MNYEVFCHNAWVCAEFEKDEIMKFATLPYYEV